MLSMRTHSPSPVKSLAGYVYQDVKAAVGHMHESGVLHDRIAASPAAYIDDSPRLVELLRGIRAAGRKTFLLTNSGYKFVARGMAHLTRGALEPGEWLSLFDFVCVAADKPSWYKEDRPFRSLNPATGKARVLIALDVLSEKKFSYIFFFFRCGGCPWRPCYPATCTTAVLSRS